MLTLKGKIPVTIHPMFFLIAGAIGWFGSGGGSLVLVPIWMVIVFISVLVHEYGHALTAVFFGQKARIDLVALGGVTQRDGPNLPPWKSFLIVLNGPLAGLSLWGLCELLLGIYGMKPSLLSYSLLVAARVNLFWTVVNLFPVQPLDGGRLLALFLESLFGLKGIKIALFISLLFSACVSALCFIIHEYLAGSLFLLFMFESWRDWRSTMTIGPHDDNALIQGMLRDAEKMVLEGRRHLAIERLEQVRRIAQKGVLYVTATQYLAELLNAEGNFQEAYEALIPIQSKIHGNSLQLLHQLAFKTGKWKEANKLGNLSFQENPNYETAILNAMANALLGKARQSVGWLQCSIREGAPNLGDILKKKEFDPIRSDAGFQKIFNRYDKFII